MLDRIFSLALRPAATLGTIAVVQGLHEDFVVSRTLLTRRGAPACSPFPQLQHTALETALAGITAVPLQWCSNLLGRQMLLWCKSG